MPSVIFDVGAHHGQTSQHFHKCFASAIIHSVEPFSENFDVLRLNIKRKKRIKVNQLALGENQEDVTLQIGLHGQSHQITNFKKEVQDCIKSVKVRMETIDNYMKNEKLTHIDLLKIDVEGYEIEVLKGAKDALKNGRVDFILAECDFNLADKQHTYFENLLKYLNCRNFSFFGLYEVNHYANRMGIGFCNALFIKRSSKS